MVRRRPEMIEDDRVIGGLDGPSARVVIDLTSAGSAVVIADAVRSARRLVVGRVPRVTSALEEPAHARQRRLHGGILAPAPDLDELEPHPSGVVDIFGAQAPMREAAIRVLEAREPFEDLAGLEAGRG